MKLITFIATISLLISINLDAQNTTLPDSTNIEALLIGEWKFVMTVDKDQNEVEFITKPYKGSDGEEMKIVADGPDIIINADYTYSKQFATNFIDRGTWKLLSNNEIEFEMIIAADSRQGKMIVKTQKLFDKKWRTDKNGNYLDASSDIIISLNEREMEIEYENNYILIYHKK